MPASISPAVIPAYLLLCLVLGGSTRGDWSNLLLQIGAIAILAGAMLASPRSRSGLSGRLLTILMVGTVAVALVQVIPLPPELWSRLPGRVPIARGFDLLGQPRPWLPLSLAPYDTIVSALWLLPPYAIVVGMLRAGAYRHSWLALAMLFATLTGIVVGALQVTSADPAQSPWYFYSITNYGRAVGLFANSNHMATLLVVTIPFVVAMYGPQSSRKHHVQSSAGRAVILGGAMLAILAGIALNGSLAGIGLAIPVLAASLFIFSPTRGRQARWALTIVGLLAFISVAAVLTSPFQNNLTTAGVEADYSSRYTTFSNGLRAAADHFPVGSGIGTFVNIYPSYENPVIADRWFVNHAHNDYIELALETGIAGIFLMLGFILWWAGRAAAVWGAPVVNHYARAATIASGAILAHSMVDYPLRMSAIAAVFAVCVALMAGPRRRLGTENVPEHSSEGGGDRPRHLSIH